MDGLFENMGNAEMEDGPEYQSPRSGRRSEARPRSPFWLPDQATLWKMTRPRTPVTRSPLDSRVSPQGSHPQGQTHCIHQAPGCKM